MMGDHAGCHARSPDVDLVHIAGEGVDVHPGCRTGPGGARSLPTGEGEGTSAPCKLQRSSVCDAQHPSCNCCPAPLHGPCRRCGSRDALCRSDQHRNTLARVATIIWEPPCPAIKLPAPAAAAAAGQALPPPAGECTEPARLLCIARLGCWERAARWDDVTGSGETDTERATPRQIWPKRGRCDRHWGVPLGATCSPLLVGICCLLTNYPCRALQRAEQRHWAKAPRP